MNSEQVFQLEKEHLNQVEVHLEKMIDRYDKSAKYFGAALNSSITHRSDYDDTENSKTFYDRLKSDSEERNYIQSCVAEPYFARLDIESNESHLGRKTYYIGEKAVTDTSNGHVEIVVLDWHSPKARLYYETDHTVEKVINGVTYKTRLCRKIDIINSELNNCHTTYSIEDNIQDVPTEQRIMDPILVRIMQEKRKSTELTNIIRTIGGEQNSIIGRPESESFIVQGCAGSGKTVVMLHRLSVLKFVNSRLPIARMKIITPNDSFKMFIYNLSNELELSAIERCTVEEYYVSLIKKFSSGVQATPTVRSEKSIASSLLAEVYSVSYTESIISRFHQYWDDALKTIDLDLLSNLLMRANLTMPSLDRHKGKDVERLAKEIRALRKLYHDDSQEIEQKRTQCKKAEKGLEEQTLKLDNLQNTATAIKDSVINHLVIQRRKGQQSINKINKRLIECKNKIGSLEGQRNPLLKKYEQVNAFSRMSDAMLRSYADYNWIFRRKDIKSVIIKKDLSKQMGNILKAEERYVHGKNSGANQDKVDALFNQLKHEKDIFSSEFYKWCKTEPVRLEQKLQSLDGELLALNQEISRLTASISTIEGNNSGISDCLKGLRKESIPDIKVTLSPQTRNMFANILMPYQEIYLEYTSCLQLVRILKQKVQIEKEQYDALLKKANLTEDEVMLVGNNNLNEDEVVLVGNVELTGDDDAFLSRCQKVMKQLSFTAVWDGVVIDSLKQLYQKHKQKYHKTIQYRFDLYLKLLICTMYFDALLSPDLFLNIDEAQDLSVVEYNLLQKILGKSCVFNLYGDINQRVYQEKGISQWHNILGIPDENVYELNYNYRNSLQITEYCNKKLNKHISPVGLPGERVLELGLEAAVYHMLTVRRQNPNYRMAVIHQLGTKEIQRLLSQFLPQEYESWNESNADMMSVLTVEQSKGLEFQFVLAITDQMTDDDKYITFTRAQVCLIVVEDPVSCGQDDDQEAEDDDFSPESDQQGVLL